jgi:cobalt-precorrin 5A hydrolase
VSASVIAFSEKGYALGKRIVSYLDTAVLTRCEHGGLRDWTSGRFQSDALIFIGSCGIAVRAIAPFLSSKYSDPAVVVIDERANFVIPLLSGHIGGANDLAVRLARFLGATSVVTTATDVNGVFAIDAWAAKHGVKIVNPERVKSISARLLTGDTIEINSEYLITGRLPEGVKLCRAGGDAIISHLIQDAGGAVLQLAPPVITLGIGCKKGSSAENIEAAYKLALANSNCHPLAVARVCSVKLKAEEPGVIDFCRKYKLPFETYSSDELMSVPGEYTASSFVKEVTGADNICERSAVLGSGRGGRLLLSKTSRNGVSVALALSKYSLCFSEREI